MRKPPPQRSDEASRSELAGLTATLILLLSLTLTLVGAILLGAGVTSGGYSLAIGIAGALLSGLSLFGRQGFGFLAVSAIGLGGFTAVSMMFLDYTWPTFFITLACGLLLLLLGAFMLGESADLHIGLDAHE